MSFLSDNESASTKLFPSQKMQGDQLIEVVTKIKEGIQLKGISISEVFRRLDKASTGLLSFTSFASEIDNIA